MLQKTFCGTFPYIVIFVQASGVFKSFGSGFGWAAVRRLEFPHGGRGARPRAARHAAGGGEAPALGVVEDVRRRAFSGGQVVRLAGHWLGTSQHREFLIPQKHTIEQR